MSAQSLRLSRPSIKIRETTIHIRQRATSLPSAAQGGRKPGKGRRRRRRTLPLAGTASLAGYGRTSADDEPIGSLDRLHGRDRVHRNLYPTFAAPKGFRMAIGSCEPVETIVQVRPRNRSERVSKYAAAMQRREKTFAPV